MYKYKNNDINDSCTHLDVHHLKLWGLYYRISVDHKMRKITIGTYFGRLKHTAYAGAWYWLMKLLKIKKIKIPINKKKYSQIENDLNYNHNYVYLLADSVHNPIEVEISEKIGKVVFYIFLYIPIRIKDFKLIRKMKRLCNGYYGGYTGSTERWHQQYLKKIQDYITKKDILNKTLS